LSGVALQAAACANAQISIRSIDRGRRTSAACRTATDAAAACKELRRCASQVTLDRRGVWARNRYVSAPVRGACATLLPIRSEVPAACQRRRPAFSPLPGAACNAGAAAPPRASTAARSRSWHLRSFQLVEPVLARCHPAGREQGTDESAAAVGSTPFAGPGSLRQGCQRR